MEKEKLEKIYNDAEKLVEENSDVSDEKRENLISTLLEIVKDDRHNRAIPESTGIEIAEIIMDEIHPLIFEPEV